MHMKKNTADKKALKLTTKCLSSVSIDFESSWLPIIL